MSSNTVSFHTLGCRLNKAETAILYQQLSQAGYTVVDSYAEADIVIVNTCTVTEHGDIDTRRIVNRICRENERARIALIGCQAQTQGEKLLQMPVDFTIPVAGIDTKHTRANLKIQDGCDYFCSYCEIPYARGRARSRQFRDLLSEARVLASAGHRELVLTGINIGLYAQDGKTITDVISALEEIPDLERIRLSSIEATLVPDVVFEKMATGGKVCRFLHMPLQSGSDRILRVMNRKYTVAEFDSRVQQAVDTVAGICIGTDVIAGFPGEMDADFQKTFDYLESSPIAYFHVFSYSDRNHSKSRKLADKVSRATIALRSGRLRELSKQKRRRYYESQIGGVEAVLFEQNKDGFWSGLTDTYIRVRVRSDEDIGNRIIPVRLERLENQAIIGRCR
jgi:threonylcarbamoyladenosine tRNA methylthiotransferase MtaB